MGINTPASAAPSRAPAGSDAALAVYVLATTPIGTQAALLAAADYAAGLDARIVLLCPHVVSFAASMEDSATPALREAERLGQIARGIDVRVDILSVLCRTEGDAAAHLPADALILAGGTGGRFWPGAVERRVTRLQRAGYQAIFIRVPLGPEG
jgi:hypothetical protein